MGTRRKRDRGRVVRTSDFSRDQKNGTKKTPSTVPAVWRFFRGRRGRSSPHRRPIHRSVHEIVRIERPGAFDLRLDLFPRPVPIKQAFSFLAALGFFPVLVCVSRNVRGASDRRVSRHRRFERVPNDAQRAGPRPCVREGTETPESTYLKRRRGREPCDSSATACDGPIAT